MSYLKFLINSIDGSLSIKSSNNINICLNDYFNNIELKKYLTEESIKSILIFQLIKELNKIKNIEFKEEIETIENISFFKFETKSSKKDICLALKNSIENMLMILENNN